MSKSAMQQMAKKVERMIPKDFGYAILVFPLKELGVANYISNARREDMIKALRAKADVLEEGLDFETPENNMY